MNIRQTGDSSGVPRPSHYESTACADPYPLPSQDSPVPAPQSSPFHFKHKQQRRSKPLLDSEKRQLWSQFISKEAQFLSYFFFELWLSPYLPLLLQGISWSPPSQESNAAGFVYTVYVPIWTLKCFWDTLWKPKKLEIARYWHFWVFFSLLVLPWLCLMLLIHTWTFLPKATLGPFEKSSSDHRPKRWLLWGSGSWMPGKGTYCVGQWHWNSCPQLAVLNVCLSHLLWHLFSSLPLGLSSNCWHLGFADFAVVLLLLCRLFL